MRAQLFIKGILIGIAKIIPGFSGAMLMISFNLYDKAIEAITTFFLNPKKNFLFLTTLSLGIISGIMLFSNIIFFFSNNYPLYTKMTLIGLIAGGIPRIKTQANLRKYYPYILGTVGFLLLVSFSFSRKLYELKNTFGDIPIWILSGFAEAVGTIIPGISATALLMHLGTYQTYLKVLGSLFNFSLLKRNLYLLIPFSISFLLGIIFLTIWMQILFQKRKSQTFSVILGIMFVTTIKLFLNTLAIKASLFKRIGSIFLFAIAFQIGRKLN